MVFESKSLVKYLELATETSCTKHCNLSQIYQGNKIQKDEHGGTCNMH